MFNNYNFFYNSYNLKIKVSQSQMRSHCGKKINLYSSKDSISLITSLIKEFFFSLFPSPVIMSPFLSKIRIYILLYYKLIVELMSTICRDNCVIYRYGYKQSYSQTIPKTLHILCFLVTCDVKKFVMCDRYHIFNYILL